jgi:hypothetical protein
MMNIINGWLSQRCAYCISRIHGYASGSHQFSLMHYNGNGDFHHLKSNLALGAKHSRR